MSERKSREEGARNWGSDGRKEGLKEEGGKKNRSRVEMNLSMRD